MSRSSSSSNSGSGGIGFFGLLQLVFIVLKLCKVIDWSWWVVLIPLWIDVVIIVGFIIFIYWLNKR